MIDHNKYSGRGKCGHCKKVKLLTWNYCSYCNKLACEDCYNSLEMTVFHPEQKEKFVAAFKNPDLIKESNESE